MWSICTRIADHLRYINIGLYHLVISGRRIYSDAHHVHVEESTWWAGIASLVAVFIT
jgi:hypothetical protein